MFRIKTDIRQYKCETKDKVEKLIRNWVIRPNDLIYNTSDRIWLPIGEHPAFTGLFDVLDEQERNTPDTVVTNRARDISDGVAGSARPEPFEEAETEEAPRDEDEQRPAVHEEEVTQLVERPAFDEDSEDARKTDVFDQDEVARSLAQTPVPPSPPEGVEPLATDEVTTMTERTLDMLKITDEEDGVTDDDGDDEVEVGEEEEPPPADEDEPVEVTEVRASDAEPTPTRETTKEEDDEPTRIEEQRVVEKKPRVGRHDLPEELFATNEISSPEVRDHLKKLDDLGELSESSETTKAQPRSNWNVRLEEDSGVAEAWGDIIESVPSVAESAELPESLRETDELQISDASDDEEEDDEHAGAVGDDEGDEDADELEVADAAIDDEDDFDDDFDDDDLDELEAPHISPLEFVSDGYKIPLPFAIRPTPDDIRRGLKPGRARDAQKDAAFPRPQPKKADEIHRRYFDLTPTPPPDRTWVISLVLVFIIALIAAVAGTSC